MWLGLRDSKIIGAQKFADCVLIRSGNRKTITGEATINSPIIAYVQAHVFVELGAGLMYRQNGFIIEERSFHFTTVNVMYAISFMNGCNTNMLVCICFVRNIYCI